MDNAKIKNQMRKLEEYLIFARGLSKVTVGGYSRSLSLNTTARRLGWNAFLSWNFERQYP